MRAGLTGIYCGRRTFPRMQTLHIFGLTGTIQ